MRINPFVYGILVLSVFLGTIFGFQAAGFWSVSGKLTVSGDQVQPSADDVNTIKGWMTLEQITTTYNVPLAELLKHFELPIDTPASSAIKDLESDLFSVTDLRTWLQSRTTPEPLGESDTNLSQTLTQAVSPTPAPAGETSLATVLPSTHIAPDRTITGKTTFQELMDWGVSPETIQTIIGEDLPPESTVIKDFITQNGLEFATIKISLQEELDQMK